MTMVDKLRCPVDINNLWRGQVACITAVVLYVSGTASPLLAQKPDVHFLQPSVLTPGAIGRGRLQRGGPLHGYFQPVLITAPPGTHVAVDSGGRFDRPQLTPRLVGMLVAPVYRLRVTNIPLPDQEGVELYPSIEIIDRTYPPPNQRLRFPIVIHLAADDLDLAIQGHFITKVIYLEDPENAVPAAEPSKDQSWFDVAEDENPLDVADRIGRPVAILRLGSRLPNINGPGKSFLYGSPPVKSYTLPEEPAPKPAPVKKAARLFSPQGKFHGNRVHAGLQNFRPAVVSPNGAENRGSHYVARSP